MSNWIRLITQQGLHHHVYINVNLSLDIKLCERAALFILCACYFTKFESGFWTLSGWKREHVTSKLNIRRVVVNPFGGHRHSLNGIIVSSGDQNRPGPTCAGFFGVERGACDMLESHRGGGGGGRDRHRHQRCAIYNFRQERFVRNLRTPARWMVMNVLLIENCN